MTGLLLALAIPASASEVPFYNREVKDLRDVGALNENSRSLADGIKKSDLTNGGTINGSLLVNGDSFNVTGGTFNVTGGNFNVTGGNVGIGTTNPARLFTVEGVGNIARFAGTSQGAIIEIYNSQVGGRNWQIGDNITSAGLFTIREVGDASGTGLNLDNLGNVMIGTSTLSGTNGKLYVTQDGSGNSAATFFVDTTAADNVISLENPNGQVGRIQISGTSTSYLTSSDRRLKKNISKTTIGLSLLEKINVVDFNFIHDTSKRMQGLIAQDVYNLYPDAISTNGDNGIIPLSASSVSWQIEYGRFTPLIIQSIQDLNNKVDAQQVQIMTLRALKSCACP